LFFFTNGALLLKKGLSIKKLIANMISIVLLFIFWGSVTLLILMPINHEFLSLREFLNALFYLKIHWNNHLWFLGALCTIYIFFPLIKLAFDRQRKSLYFFLAVVFVMTFGNVFLTQCLNIVRALFHMDGANTTKNFFGLFNPFVGFYAYSIVYFILGGLLFERRNAFLERRWIKPSVILIIFCMTVLTLYGVMISRKFGEVYDLVWNGMVTIPVLLMVASLFILSLQYNGQRKYSNIIRLVGQNSLGIYFVHVPWGTLLIKYFKMFPYSTNIFTNVILAFVILVVSLFSVLLLKKNPLAGRLVTLGVIEEDSPVMNWVEGKFLGLLSRLRGIFNGIST
jgi:surface polysaccharide O-acyltransferase-like enzyme